jgi:hypothetical protein
VGDFNHDHIPDIFAITGNNIGFGLGQAYVALCHLRLAKPSAMRSAIDGQRKA